MKKAGCGFKIHLNIEKVFTIDYILRNGWGECADACSVDCIENICSGLGEKTTLFHTPMFIH